MCRLFPVLIAVTLLVGCDFRASVNFSSNQTLESRGVKYLVPLENSSSQAGDLGFKFSGETVQAETKGDVLYVSGQSYGQVKQGDTVDLTVAGKVRVNGKDRPPQGKGPADQFKVLSAEPSK